MATYRFNPFTGLPDDIGVGGGPFQPLDADLTAIAALSGTGIAVRTGSGTWTTRTLVSGTALIDIDFPDGVGGNPTFHFNTADVDHDQLDNLTLGDAGHTQFLLLAGRTGATNDPVLSTTGDGTIYGSSSASGKLILRANTGAFDQAETVDAFSPIRLMTGATTNVLGPLDALDWDVTGLTWSVDGSIHALNIDGEISSFTIDPISSDGVVVRSAIVQRIANPAVTRPITIGLISNQNQIIADGAGVNLTNANLGGGASVQVTVTAQNGATIVGGIDALADAQWFINGAVSGRAGRGLWMRTPGGTTAGAAYSEFYGIDIEDWATGGNSGSDLAYISRSTRKGFIHAGPMRVGLGAIPVSFGAGIMLDIIQGGDIRIRDRGAIRLVEPAATGNDFVALRAPASVGSSATYDLPAAVPATDGESLTSTTAGVMSWLPMQPLDADLTAIAGLTVAEGALIIGSAAPAWSVLGIGAADKYLRSNGTTAAWADVTELGLVDTYNGVTLAGNGVPHIVAAVDSTGLTANVGLTTLYAVPADGFYRVSAYAIVTTPASVSSTLPQVNIVWTEGVSSVSQSIVLTGGVGVTPTPPPGYANNATQSALGNTTSTQRAGDCVVYADAGTNISYSTSGYMSNAAGMTYALHIRVEAI